MAKKTEKFKVGKFKLVIASSNDALSFVKTLQEKFPGRTRSLEEKKRLRKYLAGYDADYLRGIARRVLIDVVRGPRLTPADPGKSSPPPPAAGRKGRQTSTTRQTGPKTRARAGSERKR